MKRWVLVVALVLSLGINVGILSTLALHQKAPARAARHVPGTLEELARRLQLEGSEKSRFIAIQRRFLGEVRKNQREGRRVQSALWKKLGARRPDEQEIRDLVERSGRIQAQRVELLARVVLETREILDRRQLHLYRRFLSRASRRLSSQAPNRR